jgi:preprotein translocase subunit SecY
MTRITLPGAVFLGLIGILPSVAATLGVNQQFALFFGGTTLLDYGWCCPGYTPGN